MCRGAFFGTGPLICGAAGYNRRCIIYKDGPREVICSIGHLAERGDLPARQAAGSRIKSPSPSPNCTLNSL